MAVRNRFIQGKRKPRQFPSGVDHYNIVVASQPSPVPSRMQITQNTRVSITLERVQDTSVSRVSRTWSINLFIFFSL